MRLLLILAALLLSLSVVHAQDGARNAEACSYPPVPDWCPQNPPSTGADYSITPERADPQISIQSAPSGGVSIGPGCSVAGAGTLTEGDSVCNVDGLFHVCVCTGSSCRFSPSNIDCQAGDRLVWDNSGIHGY
jgi:hypothetical protein